MKGEVYNSLHNYLGPSLSLETYILWRTVMDEISKCVG